MTQSLSKYGWNDSAVAEVFKKYGWNHVGNYEVAKRFVRPDRMGLIAMYTRDLHDELIIVGDDLMYETRGDWKNWSLSQLEERLIEDERIYKQYLKQIKIKQIMNEGKTLLNL